jgi:hypothetical protein
MTQASTPATRLVAVLGGLTAALAAIAAASGILLRGDLVTSPFTTVRGEVVEVVSVGIYRFKALEVTAEGVGWDIVTVFLVVPALLLVLPGVWRGGLRARLVATGLFTYFAYQYLQYAMLWAYGPLFLVYVVILALALSALAVLAATFDLAELRSRVGDSFPRRAVVGLGVFMAGLLSVMWLPVVLTTWDQVVVEQLEGATTLVVPALDLGLLVPLGIFTAVTVARRTAVGYVLASLVVVKAVAMLVAIVAMLVVEALATAELAMVPIVVFALTAGIVTLIGWRVLGSVAADGVPNHAAPGSSLPRALEA